eukprot:1158085-Pelagomonas_calceolata.AAC.13
MPSSSPPPFRITKTWPHADRLALAFGPLQRQRMSAEDFEPLTIIGRGAFGEVGPVGNEQAGEVARSQDRIATHHPVVTSACGVMAKSISDGAWLFWGGGAEVQCAH